MGIDDFKNYLNYCVLVDWEKEPGESGSLANTNKKIQEWAEELKKKYKNIRCCDEAGINGFSLHRQLKDQKLHCEVMAPTKTPKRPGDKVKNDRKDAADLAQWYRAGQRTPVWIPGDQEEGIRDLFRLREDFQEDLRRWYSRVGLMALRHGLSWQGKRGTKKHWQWLKGLAFKSQEAQWVFEQMLLNLESVEKQFEEINQQIEEKAKSPRYEQGVKALSCLKGVDTLLAMTFLSE